MGVNNETPPENGFLEDRVEKPWRSLSTDVTERLGLGPSESVASVDDGELVRAIEEVLSDSDITVGDLPLDAVVSVSRERRGSDVEVTELIQETILTGITSGEPIDDWNQARQVAVVVLDAYEMHRDPILTISLALIESDYAAPHPSSILSLLEVLDLDGRGEQTNKLAKWLLMWEPADVDLDVIGQTLSLGQVEMPTPEEFAEWANTDAESVPSTVAEYPAPSQRFAAEEEFGRARSIGSRLNNATNLVAEREALIEEYEIYLPSVADVSDLLIAAERSEKQTVDEIARGLRGLTSPEYQPPSSEMSEAEDSQTDEEPDESPSIDSGVESDPGWESVGVGDTGQADEETSPEEVEGDSGQSEAEYEFKPASEVDIQDVASHLDKSEFEHLEIRFPKLLLLARDLFDSIVEHGQEYSDVAEEYPQVGYPDRTTAMMDISNTSGKSTEVRIAKTALLVLQWQEEGFEEFGQEMVSNGRSPYHPSR